MKLTALGNSKKRVTARWRIGLFAVGVCMLSLVRIAPAALEPAVITRDDDVRRLLSQAEQALAVNRLTTPADDNAVAYIRKALGRIPNDPRALALLNKVVDRYAELTKDAVARADKARASNLERVLTFRKRAAQIIAEYRLEEDALAQMDRHIAALGGTQAETRPILREVFESHLALAETFLAHYDRAEAAWHAEQAEVLARRYSLQDERLTGLKRRLALEQGDELGKVAGKERPKVTDPQTRLKLTELAAFYVASGRAELEQGNFPRAQLDEQAARELIAQYELSDDLVDHLSGRLLIQASARVSQPLFKVYGTF
jgi:hypothetical protein